MRLTADYDCRNVRGKTEDSNKNGSKWNPQRKDNFKKLTELKKIKWAVG